MSDLGEVLRADSEKAKEHLRDRLRDHGKLTGCTSYIQRRMSIGYNHAARIMEELENANFITAPDGAGVRHFR